MKIRYYVIGLLCAAFLAWGPTAASAASPELVGELTKSLGVTEAQATGGAGALFQLAKSKLSPADFGKVSAAVPGMDTMLKAAPSAGKGVPGLSSLGAAGGLAAVAGPFKKLGMPPEMVGKFVPVVMKYVESKGGGAVAGLLSGVFK